MEAVEDIVIVGAGVAGLATALGLHRKGVKSLVLESSPLLRASGFATGTWTNAWRALDALGVGDKIRDHHCLLTQRSVTFTASPGDIDSNLSLRVHGKCGTHEMRCVKRNILLETLERELPQGTIWYSSKIVSIEEKGNIKVLHLAVGSTIKTKVLIGCDGVNSVVAKWLGLKKPSFSGRSATRGLTEFLTNHNFKPQLLQIVGGGFRAGLVPCDERSIYWFFTYIPSQVGKEVEESATKMKEYVLKKLKLAKAPEDAIEAIERSEMTEPVSAPLRFRFPLSLIWGNISKGGVCVAGDALHPMTPDLAQGASSALEDSVVLARCLSEAINEQQGDEGQSDRITAALQKYAENRRWRSIQLITTAYVVGLVEQSDNAFATFVREMLLPSGMVTKTLLKMADYDCGKL